jgi:hypothetical protein
MIQSSFNRIAKHIRWQLDDQGMVVDSQDPQSFRDSIGATLDALLAYYPDEELLTGILNCIEYNDDGTVTLYRHPTKRTDDMSRDHVINLLLALKIYGRDELDGVVNGLQWKISDKHNFSVDSWLWMKSLTGSLKYRVLFYLVGIPYMLVVLLWNKVLYAIGGFKPEHDHDTYEFIPNDKKPKIQNQIRPYIFPAYATYKMALMLFVMPDSISKKIMQKVTLGVTSRYNWLIQIMLGRCRIKNSDVNNYDAMRGGRWSIVLNGEDDRGVIKEPDKDLVEYNNIEQDLLRAWFLHHYFNFLRNKFA